MPQYLFVTGSKIIRKAFAKKLAEETSGKFYVDSLVGTTDYDMYDFKSLIKAVRSYSSTIKAGIKTYNFDMERDLNEFIQNMRVELGSVESIKSSPTSFTNIHFQIGKISQQIRELEKSEESYRSIEEDLPLCNKIELKEAKAKLKRLQSLI